MRLVSLATVLAALCLPATALADPTGKFDVRGLNPDNGGEYTGTVRVTRTGETYKVVWTIGNDEINGIGVGVKLVGGRVVTGPASAEDTGISIAYGSGDAIGTVIYFEQPDGTWHGTWAYEGWNHVSTEDWTPRDRKTVAKAEHDKQIRALEPQQAITSPMPAHAGPKS